MHFGIKACIFTPLHIAGEISAFNEQHLMASELLSKLLCMPNCPQRFQQDFDEVGKSFI